MTTTADDDDDADALLYTDRRRYAPVPCTKQLQGTTDNKESTILQSSYLITPRWESLAACPTE